MEQLLGEEVMNLTDLHQNLQEAMGPTRIDGQSVNGVVLVDGVPGPLLCECGKVMAEVQDCLVVGFASKQDALPWLRSFVVGRVYAVQGQHGTNPARFVGQRISSLDAHTCLWVLRFALIDRHGKKVWPPAPPVL